jgi:hypothetical protein
MLVNYNAWNGGYLLTDVSGLADGKCMPAI